MTAKRFWFVPLDYHGECRFVRDNNQIGEKSMSNQEVVDTLNKFQELSINDLKQIEQLKKENEELKKSVKRQQCSNNECAKLIQEQQKENEQLKQKVDFYKYFQKDARELEKENEQLKVSVNTKRMFLMVLLAKQKLLQNKVDKEEIMNILDTIEQDIKWINDSNHIEKDLLK